MFIWTSIAHMALPLGEAGIREIPNEPAVLDAMQSSIGQQPGLYIFPGFGLAPNATRQQKNDAMQHMGENLARHPSGLLMYYPAGARPLRMVRWLTVEFVTELLEAILAVFLLSLTRLTTFGARAGFITILGILAAISTNISYWNWYGFPAVYTAAYMFTQIVGFIFAGIVVALVLKRRQSKTTT